MPSINVTVTNTPFDITASLSEDSAVALLAKVAAQTAQAAAESARDDTLAALTTKADQTALDATDAVVATKADDAATTAALAGKADQSDLNSTDAAVEALEDITIEGLGALDTEVAEIKNALASQTPNSDHLLSSNIDLGGYEPLTLPFADETDSNKIINCAAGFSTHDLGTVA